MELGALKGARSFLEGGWRVHGAGGLWIPKALWALNKTLGPGSLKG